MLEKIKNLPKNPYLRQLNDVRMLTLLGIGALALLTTWSGIKSVQTNYELQKQIARLEQEVEIARLENENLKLSNEYLNTDVFLELAARRQFGKGSPGEKLLIVPKEVAMAKTIEIPSPQEEKAKEVETEKPKYQRNLEAWIDFFFHRSKN